MDNNSYSDKESEKYEKKYALFLMQKQTLDIFLDNGAINKRQYDKSIGDLIEKMGIDIQKNR